MLKPRRDVLTFVDGAVTQLKESESSTVSPFRFSVPMETLNHVRLAKYTSITPRSPLFMRADTKVTETLRERRNRRCSLTRGR